MDYYKIEIKIKKILKKKENMLFFFKKTFDYFLLSFTYFKSIM